MITERRLADLGPITINTDKEGIKNLIRITRTHVVGAHSDWDPRDPVNGTHLGTPAQKMKLFKDNVVPYTV